MKCQCTHDEGDHCEDHGKKNRHCTICGGLGFKKEGHKDGNTRRTLSSLLLVR